MTATTDNNELRALWGNRIRGSRAADAMKRCIDRTRFAALWPSRDAGLADENRPDRRASGGRR